MTTKKNDSVSEETPVKTEEVLPVEAAREALKASDSEPHKDEVSPLISGLWVTEKDGKVRPATTHETAEYLKVIQANGGKQSF